MFIAALQTVYPGDITVILAQSLLSLLNVYLLTNMLRAFGAPALYTVLVAILLTPSQFIYANMIMSEMLFQTMILAAFYSLWRLLRKPSFIPLAAYTLFTMLAMLVKPVFYLFAAPNALLALYLGWKHRKVFYAPMAAFPFFCILTVSAWNYNRTGCFEYSSIAAENLLQYNTHLFLVSTRGAEYADAKIAEIEKEASAISDYAARQRFLLVSGRAIVLEHPLRYAVYHIKGTVNFFLDPGRFDIYRFFNIRNPENNGFQYYYHKEGFAGIFKHLMRQPLLIILTLFLILAVNVVKTISVISFIANKSIDANLRLVFVLFVGYLAFITGPLGSSRFATAALPLVLFTLPFFAVQARGILCGRKS
ncbi:MAG: hypothetical protein WC421_05810 [Elusimicrobiales bacterium]